MSTPYREPVLDPDEFTESWTATVEPQEMQVWASKVRRRRDEWSWEISFAVLEFVRESPLVEDLNDELERAILAVRGTKRIVGGDRELKLVAGRARGSALVAACMAVLERNRAKIEKALFDL